MARLDWKEIVQDYIIKHSNLIRKTTQPLRDHFGIGYFTYHRIDLEGRYTVLVDRPEWAEHYVSEKIYLIDPYLRHFRNYESGLCFMDHHGSEEYKEIVLASGKKVLNMDLCMMLIQKEVDHVEFFGFSGNKASSSIEKLYLNQPQLLRSFAAHFKDQFKPILTSMELESTSLLELKGEDFLASQPINLTMPSDAHLAYLIALGKRSELEKAAKLSVRERECLRLLIQNHSSKEIAALLRLSPRTVEFYFENIKDKLVCWSKQELIANAKIFDSLGIL